MEQLELLRFVIRTLEELGVEYMVVGSFASGAYGEPRFTQDIDIVIALPPGKLDALLGCFAPEEFYVSREAVVDSIRHGGQFNVIHPESGNKIDFMVARADAWGQEQIRRRIRIELVTGIDAFVARPEDIIISKMLYYEEGGSEKHLRDITGVMKVSADMIDRDYIQRWADDLDLTRVWQAVLRRLG